MRTRCDVVRLPLYATSVAIIDLRGMLEGACGESIKVTKMGMQYYRAPMVCDERKTQ